MVNRGEVYLVGLDPTVGSEVKKNRPCLIVSPDEMNEFLNTVIVAPMTTKGFVLPSRISITYGGKKGLVVLDQIRTVDKQRLQKRLRQTADPAVMAQVLHTLAAMFSV